MATKGYGLVLAGLQIFAGVLVAPAGAQTITTGKTGPTAIHEAIIRCRNIPVLTLLKKDYFLAIVTYPE